MDRQRTQTASEAERNAEALCGATEAERVAEALRGATQAAMAAAAAAVRTPSVRFQICDPAPDRAVLAAAAERGSMAARAALDAIAAAAAGGLIVVEAVDEAELTGLPDGPLPLRKDRIDFVEPDPNAGAPGRRRNARMTVCGHDGPWVFVRESVDELAAELAGPGGPMVELPYLHPPGGYLIPARRVRKVGADGWIDLGAPDDRCVSRLSPAEVEARLYAAGWSGPGPAGEA